MHHCFAPAFLRRDSCRSPCRVRLAAGHLRLSVRAMTLEPGLAVYGATKAGIIQLVRGLASELGPHGVRVNAIVPSIVTTPLVDPLREKPQIWNALASHTVFNRWSEPKEVAAAI